MRLVIVVMALAAAPLFADDVYLKGGGQVTGEIVEQTADSVKVDIGGGTLTVRKANVVRIEEGTSPLQEYRARAAKIAANDAEAWRGLARWADGQALATAANEAWSKVVALDPNDPEANRALGRVQLDGRWVTEEESCRARGYVEFEGEWMTPTEQKAILDERRARQEAEHQARARAQAEQQAQREREAQQASTSVDYWSGYPAYWGWGSGPSYWPSTPVERPHPVRPVQLPARGRR